VRRRPETRKEFEADPGAFALKVVAFKNTQPQEQQAEGTGATGGSGDAESTEETEVCKTWPQRSRRRPGSSLCEVRKTWHTKQESSSPAPGCRESQQAQILQRAPLSRSPPAAPSTAAACAEDGVGPFAVAIEAVANGKTGRVVTKGEVAVDCSENCYTGAVVTGSGGKVKVCDTDPSGNYIKPLGFFYNQYNIKLWIFESYLWNVKEILTQYRLNPDAIVSYIEALEAQNKDKDARIGGFRSSKQS